MNERPQELSFQGTLRADGPIYVECANGKIWVIGYGDSPFRELAGRHVVVAGRPGDVETRTTNRILGKRGRRVEHFRVSTIREIASDAGLPEVGMRLELTGRFERTTDGQPTLSFVTQSGDAYLAVNDSDEMIMGERVSIRAYPLEPGSPHPGPCERQLWIDDITRIDGEGTLRCADGVYVGKWRDRMRQGRGTLSWKGGQYVGDWLDDKRHGQGTMLTSDGHTYVGAWRTGKRHGVGTWSWNGTTYVGEWRDDKRHGRGTFTYPDGEEYVGEFRNGLRCGHGTLTKPDGETYVGEWRDEVKHGRGLLTKADGTRHDGVWENGKFVRAIVPERADQE